MEYQKSAKFYAKVMGITAGTLVFAAYVAALATFFHFGGVFKNLRAFPGSTFSEWCIGVSAVTIISAMMFAAMIGWHVTQWTLPKFRRLLYEALTPVLYRAKNNGITVLATPGQYNAAVLKCARESLPGDLSAVLGYVIPDAMVFCADDHARPCSINHLRTGNHADMAALTAGCRIDDKRIFVPFSSTAMGSIMGWQLKTFRPLSLNDATQIVQAERIRLEKLIRSRRDEVLGQSLVAVVLATVGPILGLNVDAPMVVRIIFSCAVSGALVVAALWLIRHQSRS